MPVNVRLAADLCRSLLRAPLRRVAPEGLVEGVRTRVAKVLNLAHKTNPSGNNMSQR